jgi:hypothetical protein
MKKSFYILVLISCVTHLLFTVSCNKYPTYEELKSDELKVIKRILNTKGIEVINEYPANGVFEENQFVLLNSGIYLHVVDSGSGRRAQAGASGTTEVLVRVKGEYTYSDSVYQFDTFQNGHDPFYFKYGSALSVVSSNNTSYNSRYYMLFSIGLESVLSYVGDSAVVKLIIPGHAEINNYPAGSSMQSSDRNRYIPIYYDKVKYTFY